ncbi:MAG: 4a-hydroxytetrahydrobiopterin dehydratase [Nitriliruptoraceae bacterium]
MGLLDHEDIEEALEQLDGWARDGDEISRTFRCDDFLQAIAFINRIAQLADDANHHPELRNIYDTVEVRLTTHDAGGVTEQDLDMARSIQITYDE